MVPAEIGKKNWSGRARAKILHYVSGQAEILISLSGRAGAEICIFISGRVENVIIRAKPGPKIPVRADL